MKRYYRVILILLGTGLFFCQNSCKNATAGSKKWYENTKSEILKQSNLQSDSVVSTFNEDNSYKYEQYYFEGKKFLRKGFNNEVLRLEIHYSKDQNFELRREICDNGNYLFEGIFYKNNAYGLSIWRHCNNQLQQQGLRYNGQEIGVWKKWDIEGKLVEEIDFKHLSQSDDMPVIKQ